MKYLVHIVAMYSDFKHYHMSMIKECENVNENTITRWELDAEQLITNKNRISPEETYVVGFNKL